MTPTIALLIFASLNVANSYAEPALQSELINSKALLQFQENQHLDTFTDPEQLSSVGIPYLDPADKKGGKVHSDLQHMSFRLNPERAAVGGLDFSASSFCAELGYGCLLPTFLNPSEEIRAGKLGPSSVLWELGLNSYLYAESTLSCREGETIESKWHHYKSVFKNAGYFNPGKRRKLAEESIQKAFIELEADLDAKKFTQSVLFSSEGFPILPKIYKKALANKDSESVIRALSDTIQNALLLTLDAISLQADSSLGSYPFHDQLLTSASIMKISSIHASLKELWPNFSALTPAVRDVMKGSYIEQLPTVGKMVPKWKVKGVYNDLSNTIWIDYSTPFYDNVYVLYHELWHAVWNHSQYAANSIQGVVDSLNDPKISDDAIKSKLLNLVSENEFLDLDQQIRLYHALGMYTDAWSGEVSTSAKNWHDSYLGRAIYETTLSKEFRKKHADHFHILLIDKNIGEGVDKAKSLLRELGEPILDEKYYQRQRVVHEKIFNTIYLNDDFKAGFPTDIVQLETQVLDSPMIEAEAVSLSCAQAKRILSILGSGWDFGIPFPYQISDKNCDVHRGPGHPGTAGTHGGFEWTLPKGFPSLEGPNL